MGPDVVDDRVTLVSVGIKELQDLVVGSCILCALNVDSEVVESRRILGALLASTTESKL